MKSPIFSALTSGNLSSLPARIVVLIVALFGQSPLARADFTKSERLDHFYDAKQVVAIKIQMKNWKELKKQAPLGGKCTFGYLGKRFTWFTAEEISINGTAFPTAGIKKRSWCGSYSQSWPSLSIDLARETEGNKEIAKNLFGTSKLTLSNSIQDPSLVRQCLAYRVFAAAGVPVPRCNFAHIYVNDTDYGVYVNLEAYDKTFIEENFGMPLGNLYEFEKEDMRADFDQRFEFHRENFGGEESIDDLQQFIAALDNVGKDGWSPAEERMNLDEVMNFWAGEILLSHWDGFMGNINNSYAFFDGEGRVHLLPWGTDQVLARGSDKVYQKNRLGSQLYSSSHHRGLLKKALPKILTNAWNEADLMTQVGVMVATIEPHLQGSDLKKFTNAIDVLKTNIQNRRSEVEKIIRSMP